MHTPPRIHTGYKKGKNLNFGDTREKGESRALILVQPNYFYNIVFLSFYTLNILTGNRFTYYMFRLDFHKEF